MSAPADRRHERILDRAFPALPGDHLADRIEDDRQITPDQRADQQVQHQERRIDLLAAYLLHRRADERDGKAVDDAVNQPDDFPSPVSLGQIDVSLYERVGRAKLSDDGGHLSSINRFGRTPLLPRWRGRSAP